MKYFLFVCAKNAARSPMAEKFFNTYNQNPEYAAVSAGTNPKGAVNEQAAETMAEKGLDISGHRPQLLTEKMIEEAERIFVLCSESCPVTPPEKTEKWELEDPCGKGVEKFREVRDQIEEKIKLLVKKL
jgi:arsenate reductase (thioredoxin)